VPAFAASRKMRFEVIHLLGFAVFEQGEVRLLQIVDGLSAFIHHIDDHRSRCDLQGGCGLSCGCGCCCVWAGEARAAPLKMRMAGSAVMLGSMSKLRDRGRPSPATILLRGCGANQSPADAYRGSFHRVIGWKNLDFCAALRYLYCAQRGR